MRSFDRSQWQRTLLAGLMAFLATSVAAMPAEASGLTRFADIDVQPQPAREDAGPRRF